MATNEPATSFMGAFMNDFMTTEERASCKPTTTRDSGFACDVANSPLLALPDLVAPDRSRELSPGMFVAAKSRVARIAGTNEFSLDEDDLDADTRSPWCKEFDVQLSNETVRLRVLDLMTLLPGRWLDSVVIDAYIHVLQRHFKHRKQLFILSAEKDPTFADLIATPPCFRYLLIPLFHHDHWTLTWIDHGSKEVRYYNSQIVSNKEVEKQLEPFKEHFPNYAVTVMRAPQQCDTSSCGLYVCAFCYCLLNDISQIDRIQCWHAPALRETVLRQLLLSFVFVPLPPALRC